MEQNDFSAHPAASAIADAASLNSSEYNIPAQPTYRPRHDGWDRDKMARFIECLAETGSVADAAAMVGMSRQSAYRLRSRLVGQPFDFAWEGALEFGLQQLAHRVLDRCLNGVRVPIVYKGEIVGERRVFNERASFNILQNAEIFGRMTFERDMAVRRWPEMISRLRQGPVIWTDDEKHGCDPDHPMNMNDDELDELAVAEAESDDDDNPIEAASLDLKKQVEKFFKEESHYAKPVAPFAFQRNQGRNRRL